MKLHGKHYRVLDDDAARQYINARATFTAWEQAQAVAANIRGGMHWKRRSAPNSSTEYLIRTSANAKRSETSLGPRSEKTERIYGDFIQRKQDAADRLAGLKAAVEKAGAMNRALRVGQVPLMVVEILNRIAQSGLTDHFRVVGTHALYAYEAAAGIHFGTEALATMDIDLLWDVRKRIAFSTALARVDGSMLGVLQRVDKSFRLRDDQKYTAVNNDGFEVDIIRREQTADDPHPIKLSESEDDFWVAQAPRAQELSDAPPFSAIVVATNGAMARMDTIAPAAFVHFKRWMSALPGRESLKRRRDALQADVVEEILHAHLPHLDQIFPGPDEG
ncbi:MAG: hypothetical protein JO002_11105 [Burkholderiaceae bacterium]|nr:hypothetical protein [Burkholderiaceae bacterium]